MNIPEGFKLILDEDVDIYLQGEYPLITTEELEDGKLYHDFVLGKLKNIKFYYYRTDFVKDVEQFQIPSHVQIYVKEVSENDVSEIIIYMTDSHGKNSSTVEKTLYFGILSNNNVPELLYEWVYYQESGDDVVFVTLVSEPLRDMVIEDI